MTLNELYDGAIHSEIRMRRAVTSLERTVGGYSSTPRANRIIREPPPPPARLQGRTRFAKLLLALVNNTAVTVTMGLSVMTIVTCRHSIARDHVA